MKFNQRVLSVLVTDSLQDWSVKKNEINGLTNAQAHIKATYLNIIKYNTNKPEENVFQLWDAVWPFVSCCPFCQASMVGTAEDGQQSV